LPGRLLLARRRARDSPAAGDDRRRGRLDRSRAVRGDGRGDAAAGRGCADRALSARLSLLRCHRSAADVSGRGREPQQAQRVLRRDRRLRSGRLRGLAPPGRGVLRLSFERQVAPDLMDTSVELVRHLLQSVVYIHTKVSSDHPSTRILGNERLGSGVVVDSSGLILTVNYVVMGGSTISVAFQKGRRAKAELVAQDFEVGLALIKVNRQGLVAAEVGTGDVVDRCDEVVLLGAMGPQERRATSGVVTYVGEF